MLTDKQKEQARAYIKQNIDKLDANKLKNLKESDINELFKTGTFSKAFYKPVTKNTKPTATPATTTTEPVDNTYQENVEWTKPFEISDAEWNDIMETQKSYYEPYYDKLRWQTTQDFKSDINDVDRLIQYTNTDYAKQLASENQTFARTLSKATNAYASRWLFWSGIQKSQIWEWTQDYQKSLTNMEEYRRRKEEWYETQKSNIKTKYDRWMESIDQSQQAQAYFDSINEVSNRRWLYGLDIASFQKTPEAFVVQKPTTPTNPMTNTDINKKLNK